jgi:hypothetical protein
MSEEIEDKKLETEQFFKAAFCVDIEAAAQQISKDY